MSRQSKTIDGMRECCRCKKILPATREYFYSHWSNGLGAECKTCSKERVKRERFATRHSGVPLEVKEELLIKQHYKCAICGTNDSSKLGHGWHLDHDHKRNKVRGVLCANCNVMIGHAKDDIDVLFKAIQYLKKGDNQ